ncbi:Uncharacterised protein [Mycobacteroides abscessus subsp. abscessus]|nr:Uncharacterised protein [Mycobacteroides abscessus subsp. abscessus]
MLRVVGQHTEYRGQVSGDLNELVGVIVQGPDRGAGGLYPGADECAQLVPLLGQGLHGAHRLMQGIDEIRCGLRESVRGLHQRRDRRGALVGRDDGVELIQHAVQLCGAGEQFGAPMIGGGPDRRQNPHGVVLAAAAGRGQDLAQLVDGGLEQHGRQSGVLGDMPALANGRSGSVVDEL